MRIPNQSGLCRVGSVHLLLFACCYQYTNDKGSYWVCIIVPDTYVPRILLEYVRHFHAAQLQPPAYIFRHIHCIHCNCSVHRHEVCFAVHLALPHSHRSLQHHGISSFEFWGSSSRIFFVGQASRWIHHATSACSVSPDAAPFWPEQFARRWSPCH